MKRSLPLRLAAVCLVAALRLSAAEKSDLQRITPVPADQPVPLQDFFRPLLLQEPKLNHAGTRVAAIITVGESGHQLLVHDLKTLKNEYVGAPGDYDLYDVSWLNDTRLIFNLAAEKRYGIGLMAADVGRLDEAHPLVQYYFSSVLSVPPGDRLHPLVWNRHDGLETDRDLGVAVINTDLRRGHMANLLVGSGSDVAMDARDNNERHILRRYPVPPDDFTSSYVTDRNGQLAFAITARDGRFTLYRLEGGQWLKCPVDLEQIEIVAAGDEPNQLVVVGPRQDGRPRALQFMDAASGKLGEVLLQDKAYDFAGWLYRSPTTHEITGAVFNRNGPRVAWFNEEYRQLQKTLDGFFPGLSVRIISSDEAQGIFLVATYSDRQPVVYNIVNLTKGTVGPFKNAAPWIDPKRMQPQNIIKFKTRDGRQLDAYLTLPAGATKENPPPLVVLPHGGPWARDYWGFDGEAQFLASRGYAVLKPNYRGSTGYNWMFPEEDEWDFRKMHDDVTDATKTLIASGVIDPKRVGIMGGSFGGYLAVSGAVNEPDLYRCAVTIAGVFDWEYQIAETKDNRYDSPVFDRLMRKLGDPARDKEKFAAISPGRRVERIRIPVFVSGGTADQTVEIRQSTRLLAALEKYNVPHESFIVRSEGHGMGHLSNQVELYSRIEAFLEKNLKNAK